MSQQPGPASVRAALEHWCAAGETGALRILGPPGGEIYLIDGRVAYAECPASSGIEDLLAISAGAELELIALSALSALFGATMLQLDATADTRFDAGVRHPFGVEPALTLEALCSEVDRRRTILPEGTDERLPRRRPGSRIHPIARRRYDDPPVPIGTLLRIRRALEEQL
jgi:hypothetical protein